MKDYLLLRTQKNEIFECIKNAGLIPLNFEWGEEITNIKQHGGNEYPVSLLKYLNTDFYFKFDHDTLDQFYCKSHPSTRYIDDKLGFNKKYNWDYALLHFREWLSRD